MPNPTEAKTRKESINPALQQAGWDVENPDQVGIEIPVDGFDPAAWPRLEVKLHRLREASVPYEVELPAGVSDYALYRPNGEIMAVVETKRTSIDPRLARAQTEFYVTELEKRQSFRPFGFMTNGREIHFWDVGQSAGGAGLFLAAGSGDRHGQNPSSDVPGRCLFEQQPGPADSVRGDREAPVEQPFNADQVRFLRAVQNVFLQRHKLEVADLYDPPLTQFGRDAVERWFSETEIEEMLTFVETLAV